MKAWLKGGLIGGLIGIVLWILGLIAESNQIILREIIWFLRSPSCRLICLGDTEIDKCVGWCFLLYGHILNIITFFIIGAIIGLIIGKIKSKKQPKELNQTLPTQK